MHRLNTLGGLGIEANGVPIHDFGNQRKSIALLALLATAGKQGMPRDKILAYLWPEATTAQARNALNQIAHRIRRQFGDGVLIVTNGDLALDMNSFSSDVSEFRLALSRGELSHAVSLYRGPFLDGFHLSDVPEFEEWAERERARLVADYAGALERLAQQATHVGDFGAAVAHWRVRAALDPLSERTTRGYVAALAANGERDVALRHVTAQSALVREETGVDNERELRSFVLAIPSQAVRVEFPRVVTLSQAPRDPASAHRSRRASRWAAAFVVSVAVIVLAVVLRRSAPDAQPSTFPAGFPDSTQFRADAYGGAFAISPTGTELAYVGGGEHQRIFRRALTDLTATTIAGTQGGTLPVFSPDGEWIAFKVDGQLRKVPRQGGKAIVIADSVKRFSWGDGDVVVFQGAKRRGLWRTSATHRDAPIRVTDVDASRGETAHTWPHVLPGGEVVVFDIAYGESELPELAAVRISGGGIVRLGVRGVQPRFVDGLLVFGIRDGNVAAVAFDHTRLRVTSPVARVLEHAGYSQQSGTRVALSESGTLVYIDGAIKKTLMLVDASGRAQPLLAVPGEAYSAPRFSPNGARLAFSITSATGSDVWTYDVRTGSRTKISRDGESRNAEWSADGSQLTWHTRRDGVDRILIGASDGGGSPGILVDHALAMTTSPVRNASVFETASASYWRQVSVGPPEWTEPRMPLTSVHGSAYAARISPDGRWVAFVSDGQRVPQIYITSIDGGAAFKVPVDEGRQPVWGRSARELYFRGRDLVLRATLGYETGPRVVKIDTLFGDVFVRERPEAEYDVARDGRTFAFTQTDARSARPIIKIGWLDEVRDSLKKARR